MYSNDDEIKYVCYANRDEFMSENSIDAEPQCKYLSLYIYYTNMYLYILFQKIYALKQNRL